MKQILVLAFVALLMTACQKNNSVAEDETNAPITAASLTGKWELRTAHANISNCCNYPPGNGSILKFSGNQYELYEKNTLKKSGPYLVMADTTVVANTCLALLVRDFPNRLVYDSNFSSPKTFFNIKNGQLMVISGCFAADAGHTETYDPIK